MDWKPEPAAKQAPDPGSGAHLGRRHVTGGWPAGAQQGGAGLAPPPGARPPPRPRGGWAHLAQGRVHGSRVPGGLWAVGQARPCHRVGWDAASAGRLHSQVCGSFAAKSLPSGFAQFLGVTSRLRLTQKYFFTK